MERLIIDRFEDKYAVCEDGERGCVLIEKIKLPPGVKEGCVLVVSADGVTIDHDETEFRRERMAEKQRRLFDR